MLDAQQQDRKVYGGLKAVAELERQRPNEPTGIDLRMVERYATEKPEDPVVVRFREIVEEVVTAKSTLREALRRLRSVEHTMILLAEYES